MKINTCLAMLFFMILLFSSSNGINADQEHNDLSYLLAGMSKLSNYKATGKPQLAEGMNLFILINGGAEIYFEYGFKRAIIASYKNTQGQIIDLQIFEMTSSETAYGIHTYKTDDSGEAMSIGQGALFEDYYLNLWKDKFQITVSVSQPDQKVKEDLATIARAVDSEIKSKGNKPVLMKLLPKSDKTKVVLKYFKGNLALSTFEASIAGSITDFNEGAIGFYDQYKIALFKYASKKQLSEVAPKSKLDDNVHIQSFENYLMAVIAKKSINFQPIFDSITSNIRKTML